MPDNSIAWLEPTAKCNLACEGCYHANINEHKSLDVVAADLDVFERTRTVDGISIAGGEPLTHPNIVDIVRMVSERGWKPIVNTNGLALNEELLRDIGLSPNEARVYEALLHTGEASVQEISIKAKVHRRNVYDSLSKLSEKGLASELFIKGEKNFKA